MPRVALDWRPTRLDRESIVRSLGLLAAALGREGVGRLQVGVIAPPLFVASSLQSQDLEHLDFETWSGFHHMGTARMHADPLHGVVDADCRVHWSRTSSSAGRAVFPTSGSSPPTLTIVALALRLADHLRNKVLR